MSFSYDKIDDRINLIYDATHDIDSNECFTFGHQNYDVVSIQNIKMSKEYDNSELINSNYEFLRYDEKKNKIYLIRKSKDSHNTLAIIGVYDDITKIENMLKCEELYNSLIMYMMSETMLNENIRTLSLPIMFLDIKMNEIKKNDEVMKYLKKNKMEKNDVVNIQFIENFNNEICLTDYLENNDLDDDDWREILFKIIYTLWKVNKLYGYFLHGELSLDNIFISKIDGKKEKYNMGDKIYEVSNKFSIKITNFYKSILDMIQLNSLEKINIFGDIYYLLSSVDKYSKKNKELKNFIGEIIYDKIKSDGDDIDLSKIKDMDTKLILSHVNIIQKDYFKTYSKIESKGGKINHDVKGIKMSKLQKKEKNIDYSNSEILSEKKISNKYYNKPMPKMTGVRKLISNNNKTFLGGNDSSSKSDSGTESDKKVKSSSSSPITSDKETTEIAYSSTTEMTDRRRNKPDQSNNDAKPAKRSSSSSSSSSSDSEKNFSETSEMPPKKDGKEKTQGMFAYPTIGDPIPDSLMSRMSGNNSYMQNSPFGQDPMAMMGQMGMNPMSQMGQMPMGQDMGAMAPPQMPQMPQMQQMGQMPQMGQMGQMGQMNGLGLPMMGGGRECTTRNYKMSGNKNFFF